MAALFEAVVSWPTLLMVLLVFGFAPGFVLRVVVCCYPKDDPRRAELIADLYPMKYVERPLWVATQIETALFEGLSQRWRRMGRWGRVQALTAVVGVAVMLAGFVLGSTFGAAVIAVGGITVLMSLAIVIGLCQDEENVRSRRRRRLR